MDFVPTRRWANFYSHVNFSVTKIEGCGTTAYGTFYSHVNFSVTKIDEMVVTSNQPFTVT